MAELAKKLQSIVNEWDSCADCNNPYPEWADISRGIIICLQCSGIHRELGTHVSKVRSLTLDVWQSEWVDKMQASNTSFNELYEYHVPSEYPKPTEDSSRELRTAYITAKYVGSDTSSVELHPMFHRDGPYKDEPPLPPVFDTGTGDDALDGEQSDEESIDSNASPSPYPTQPTKNGTRPWRDRRNRANKKRHSRTDSGMTQYTGVLHLHCLNAVNLPKGNMMNTKRNTFCSFDNGFQEVCTKVVKKNNHPEWNQRLILSVNENECIKVAICNDDKKKTVLCYQFLDPKDYPQPDQKYEVREWEMTVHHKYSNDKRYKKEGRKILLNFDLEYNKMSSEIDTDIAKRRESRLSLILDNTKIMDSSISALHDDMDEQDEEEQFERIEEGSDEDGAIDDEMDKFDSDRKQERRDSVELKQEESTSPPPMVRPGDTEDEFIAYDLTLDEQFHSVRLTENISNVISGIPELKDDDSYGPPPTFRPGDTEDQFVSCDRNTDNEYYHRVKLTDNMSSVVSTMTELKQDESSSSPPPTGRPGDTQDQFVFVSNTLSDYHRVRLTGNISNVVHDMEDDEALQERKQEEEEHAMPAFGDQQSTVIHKQSTQGVYSQIEREPDYLQLLVQFNETEITQQAEIDMNGTIEVINKVLNLRDKQVIDTLVESIRKLNEYLSVRFSMNYNDDLFKRSALRLRPTQSRTAEEEQEEELYEMIIDRLRDLRNRVMDMNRLSLHLEDVFYKLSDRKYDKQYLLQDLSMTTPFSRYNKEIFHNLLLSADADNIEHVLAEILKMHESDAAKLHDVIHLILECINNNNVNVKQLSVRILAKFSVDKHIQQAILSAKQQMLRILAIIDHIAFVDISYNIIVQVEMDGVYYKTIKRHIAQYLVDEYEDYQYNLDQNHILQLIALENVKRNVDILNEQQLIDIINEHIDEVEEENGLNLQFSDMLLIAKSKQILGYQMKSECARIMQSYFRGYLARKQYQQMRLEHKQSGRDNELQRSNESLSAENRQLKQALDDSQRQNTQNSQLLQQQQSEIERLQQLVQSLQRQQTNTVSVEDNVNEDLMNKMNELHDENKSLRQERQRQSDLIAQQTQTITALKQQHLTDKQQFTMKMMNEMNSMREQLKWMGRQQLLQQKKQTQNGSYFGLW